MKKNILLSFIIFFCASSSFIQAAIKGSTTLVSVEPFFQFPAVDNDNKMEAFGWFANGFGFEDNATQCNFASVYPVSGVVAINGGSLHLLKDIVFKNNSFIESLGSVFGNGNALELCTSITSLPETPGYFDSLTVVLSDDVIINSTITFSGNCTLDGGTNEIKLGQNGALVVASNSKLTCKNLKISGIKAANIRCEDDTAILILDNVEWAQIDDASFEQGMIQINSHVAFVGTYTFSYQSLQASSILSQSEWHISDGMRFEIGKNPLGDWPLTFTDHSSVLHLDNCNYVVNQGGVRILDGTIMYSRDVVVDILSTDTTNGSFMGNGDVLHDPIVQFNPGSTAHFVGGHFVWDVVDTTKLRSDSTSVMIERSQGNTYFIKQNLTLSNFTVSSDQTVITNFALGKTLTYDRCLFILPNGQVAITGSRYNAYTSLLRGDDSIFLQYGTLPLATFCMGTDNFVQGNGSISGPLAILNGASSFVLGIEGQVTGPVTLNNGTLVLGKDTHFAGTARITDSGTVDLNTSRLTLSSTGVNWSGNINWLSTNASIVLGSDLALAGAWTFNNVCTLQGFGNLIDLSSGGSIIIAPNSTLRLSHVRIKGISGSNIRCADDTSHLILDEVIWVQDNDFLFEHGSITFNDTVDFLGSHAFTYASKQSSTVNEKSTWRITDDMHCYLGKNPDPAAHNPLLFADQTAVLHLDNCNFTITGSGWEFLRGSVQFSRDVALDVESSELANGVAMGDGTPENDPYIFFDPTCNARFLSGYLIYNIVDPANLHSDTNTVSMIRSANSNFKINQNIILKNFTVNSAASASTEIGNDLTFKYDNCVFVLPNGRTLVTAYRHDSITNLLQTGDSLFVRNGTMPMVTYAAGNNITIAGSGDVTGPIILLGPSAHVTCGLIGSLASFIQLNGGTFSLDSNVRLKDATTFTTFGTVELDATELALGSKDTVWTSTLDWQSNGGIIKMNANVTLNGHWTLHGDCAIIGNGNVLDFEKIGAITVAGGVHLTLKDMRIINIVDSSIMLAGDTSKLTLDNVTWVQAEDFEHDKGSIEFKNVVNFNGPYQFKINSAITNTVSYNTSWCIAPGMELLLGKQGPMGAQPLYFEDGSSTLRLNNCLFTVNEYGMSLTRGHILCTGDVVVDIHSTSTQNGLFLGDGTDTGNMIFEFNTGSNVNFSNGHAVYDVTVPTCVLSRTSGAVLTRGATSNFYIKQNILLQNLVINASFDAITNVVDGKTFMYKNATLNVPGGVIVVNAERYNAATNLMNGNDSIFVTAGSNPMYTVVTGTQNYLTGNGAINGLIRLVDSSAQLTIGMDGLINQIIELNGGTIILNQNLHFANSKHFEGAGRIELTGNELVFGAQESIWEHEIEWVGGQGQIDFNADVALSTTWTFSGSDCVINFNGNTLDLSAGGQLVINDGVTLHIKNAEIKGIIDANIRCVADSSKLLLDQVTWMQSGNYSFAQGSLEWKHDNIIYGNSEFTYASGQACVIDPWSTLSLDFGITLKYDPITTGTQLPDRQLIQFADATSVLTLRGANIYAPHGITLLNGTLEVLKNAALLTDSINNPIVIGDQSIQNDCKVNVGGGVELMIARGSLDYKNASPDSWSSGNNLATLHMADHTVLRLYQSLDMGLGRALFGDITALLRAQGHDLIGLITTQGELAFGDL